MIEENLEMTINNFGNLIRELPVSLHAVSTQYTRWEDNFGIVPPEEIAQIFNGSNEIKINRQNILSDVGLRRKIYKTIFWGYPTGMRGNNHQLIFSNIDVIYNLLLDLQDAGNQINNWENHISQLNIPGLGITTYTKLLYFCNVHINRNKAVILDKNIINCINNNIFEEFNGLVGINYLNAKKLYPNYLEVISNIAHQIDVFSDKIEYFIFLFGNNLLE